MKHLHLIIPFILSCSVVACNGTNGTSDPSNSYNKFDSLTKDSSAKFYHEDDRTIVSRTENGDRVYWFLAPDVDKATPAMFKKTVHATEKAQETVTVSECEAPKQVCDDLMKRFKILSEKYK